MPTTRYLPTGIFDSGSFTDLIGSGPDVAGIDEDPTSPNLFDGMRRLGVASDADSLNLYAQPPVGSLDPPIALQARIYGHCTNGVGYVSLTAASLVDDLGNIAATYTGTYGFGTGDVMHEIPMLYTPGTYDWTTARLVLDFAWSNTSDLYIYAADYVVIDDTGPGGQLSRNAAFFMMLINP